MHKALIDSRIWAQLHSNFKIITEQNRSVYTI